MANLPDSLIIFLVIAGCMICVLIGYSLHYIATNGFVDEKTREMSYEQSQYMRHLRQRNLQWMAREAREARGRRDVETPSEAATYTQ